MNAPGDDAQRDMEQRALRNVRALVDKIENKDQVDRQALRKQVVVIVVGIVVAFAVMYGLYLAFAKKEPQRTIILPPPANAPK